MKLTVHRARRQVRLRGGNVAGRVLHEVTHSIHHDCIHLTDESGWSSPLLCQDLGGLVQNCSISPQIHPFIFTFISLSCTNSNGNLFEVFDGIIWNSSWISKDGFDDRLVLFFIFVENYRFEVSYGIVWFLRDILTSYTTYPQIFWDFLNISKKCLISKIFTLKFKATFLFLS